MTRRGPRRRALRVIALLMWAAASGGAAQTATVPEAVNVSGTVQVQDAQASGGSHHPGRPDVAVWLTPRTLTYKAPSATSNEHYRMLQKDKTFSPHLLVVPVGTYVEFPNLDPFYHNVFSLFNGKRFDLGLYEAGSTRKVRFEHEGVSFIFCNIHPEMAAIVIALTTPYFATSGADGRVSIRDVPPGLYDLHLWAEGVRPETLQTLSRPVRVEQHATELGTLRVVRDDRVTAHKKKFGEDYPPVVKPY